jgi:hypothetical protein
LVLRKGRMVWHGRLADLRQEAETAGRKETLEDVFFRLTEGPAEAVAPRPAGEMGWGEGNNSPAGITPHPRPLAPEGREEADRGGD